MSSIQPPSASSLSSSFVIRPQPVRIDQNPLTFLLQTALQNSENNTNNASSSFKRQKIGDTSSSSTNSSSSSSTSSSSSSSTSSSSSSSTNSSSSSSSSTPISALSSPAPLTLGEAVTGMLQTTYQQILQIIPGINQEKDDLISTINNLKRQLAPLEEELAQLKENQTSINEEINQRKKLLEKATKDPLLKTCVKEAVEIREETLKEINPKISQLELKIKLLRESLEKQEPLLQAYSNIESIHFLVTTTIPLFQSPSPLSALFKNSAPRLSPPHFNLALPAQLLNPLPTAPQAPLLMDTISNLFQNFYKNKTIIEEPSKKSYVISSAPLTPAQRTTYYFLTAEKDYIDILNCKPTSFIGSCLVQKNQERPIESTSYVPVRIEKWEDLSQKTKWKRGDPIIKITYKDEDRHGNPVEGDAQELMIRNCSDLIPISFSDLQKMPGLSSHLFTHGTRPAFHFTKKPPRPSE